MQDGSYRPTTWTDMVPKCYCYSVGRTLYVGQAGYIGIYDTYYDNGEDYRISYYTTWVDFGDPIRTSVLKKVSVTTLGAISQVLTFKWGFDYVAQTRSEQLTVGGSQVVAEYNIAEYGIAEYSLGQITDSIQMNAGGSGKVVQAGVEADVSGTQISIQRFDMYTKDGAYK